MKRLSEPKKYNSVVNVVGSIPDYYLMIDYLINSEKQIEDYANFKFRTDKATSRFKKAVADGFLSFTSEAHKSLFFEMLNSSEMKNEEKLIALFWQFLFTNILFRETTENVFLRFLLSGRTSIETADVEAFLKHLKSQFPEEVAFSDNTLKTVASKYLTVLKKFGLADGKIRKQIRAPHISEKLFEYLVRFALAAYPDQNNLNNLLFRFSFLDQYSIINRLKSIDYIPLWDITQIGNEVTITLK